MSENKKVFFKWWFIAALIYLIFSAVVTWHYGVHFLMPLNDDTAHHIQLAKNLINYRTFSLDGLNGKYETLPLKPTNFLTPGYALWLALIYIIFKSFVPAIFIGALIFSLSVPLTYFLAKEITGSEKISFWSTLVFMIEPLSIYHSGIIYTEQLFVPIFLLAVYFFIKYLKTSNKNFVFGSLIVFSLSTLIRSTVFYFLPILVFIVICRELRASLRRALTLGAISLILAYSVIGVWIIRNKIVLDTWQITGNQGAILFGYHYEPLMRNLGLKPESQKLIGGGRDVFSSEYNKKLSEFAIREIYKNKIAYFKMRAAYFPLFFVSNGYDNIFNRLTGAAGFDKYFRWDLVSNFQKGDIISGVKMLFDSPKIIAAILTGVLFWFLVSLLAVAGFLRLLKERENHIIAFIGLLILYFAFVTTPLITARYRLPVNPFIFIFVVSGFYFLKEKLKQWI